ncbi:unnamed protein product, partial [Vitis vinifera]
MIHQYPTNFPSSATIKKDVYSGSLCSASSVSDHLLSLSLLSLSPPPKLSNPEKHPQLILYPPLSFPSLPIFLFWVFSSSPCIKSLMMSPDDIPANPVSKDETQGSGGRKTGAHRPPDQVLKCPRCDSPNTKFCYYNNYSLTQPRHFCKTCRRYWTKGGALRNVPIGGGCRKNKKIKSSSRLSAVSTPCFSIDQPGSSSSLMGFNYPLPSVLKQGESGGFGGAIQDMGSMNVHSSLASSIESLSSINQDLHWKLQQQRLAMLFGGENQKDSSVSSVPPENQNQKLQPILFQNLEISKPEVCAVGNSRKDSASGNPATEWFFDTYTPVTPTTTNTSTGGNGNDNTNHWNGIQAWSDLHQYSTLP